MYAENLSLVLSLKNPWNPSYDSYDFSTPSKDWENLKRQCDSLITKYQDLSRSIEIYNECILVIELTKDEVFIPLRLITKKVCDNCGYIDPKDILRRTFLFYGFFESAEVRGFAILGVIFYIGLYITIYSFGKISSYDDEYVQLFVIGLLISFSIYVPLRPAYSRTAYLSKIRNKLFPVYYDLERKIEKDPKDIQNMKIKYREKSLTKNSFILIEEYIKKIGKTN